MTKAYKNYNEVTIPDLLEITEAYDRSSVVRRKQYINAYAFILGARRYYGGLLFGNLAVETAKLYFSELPKDRAGSLRNSSADMFSSSCSKSVLEKLSMMKGIVTICSDAETGAMMVYIDTYFERVTAIIDRKGRISLRVTA